MTVKRIPKTRWSVRKNGHFAYLSIKGVEVQIILWLSWVSMFEQSLIMATSVVDAYTGDPKRPELWLYRGHLYKTPYGMAIFQVEQAAGNQQTNYNPRYTTWWYRVSAKARIAMEITHRISIGLAIPANLWQRYISGGNKSIQSTADMAGRIKASRFIPQWVKIEVVLRDQGRCRDCGCTDATLLEFDHLTSYADGGPSDDPKNIGLRCLPCNRRKGRKSEVRA